MIILPTKRLSEENSLIGLGGLLLTLLNRPKTVSQLWDESKKKYTNSDGIFGITFDWFILSLDLLYAIGAVSLQDGLIIKAKTT